MRRLQYILYLTVLLGFPSCTTHYYMNKIKCDSAFGGAVWGLYKGKAPRGIIFSENRLTFPAPYNFSSRFTPEPLDIELADKILRDNAKAIISEAKKLGWNYTLKKDNCLKKYFRQYIGGINALGERQIFMVLYLKSSLSPTDDYTNLITVCDGGDSYITALINLDTLKLDDFSIGG